MKKIARIRIGDRTDLPRIGQGTWRFGENPSEAANEIAVLREGIDLGLTLIDTAEMYGDGGAEQIVGAAVADQRERVFLVTKVYPHNASRSGLPAACERSLRRLRIETIDLYLLHWRGNVPLAETIAAFEKLKSAGKIRCWGVSNFDVADMAELGAVTALSDCAANQVLYHPGARGIEFDLLPWCAHRNVPVMAYSPLGQGGHFLRNKTLSEIARRHDATRAQIVLAWALRQKNVVVIPKAGTSAHVRENAAAAAIRLREDDLRAIDEAFPPPRKKHSLEMV
jgi:diketogulonate reductase-like aldo/keto reductase